MTNQNMPIPDPSWDYSHVWELMHESMELIVDARKLLGECEECDDKVNKKVFVMFVEAAMKLDNCSRYVSAMTKEN